MSLDPELYAQLHPLVTERQRRTAERNTAEARIDELNNEIGALFVAHGIEKGRVDKWSVTVGMGSRTFIDDTLLIENGVDPTTIARSKRTVHFPRVDVREVGQQS